MNNINIVYEDKLLPIGSLPDNLPMKNFFLWIMGKMKLPTTDLQGHHYKYTLKLERTGQILDMNGTIAESGIVDSDEIQIICDIQNAVRDLSMNAEPIIEIIPATDIDKELPLEKEMLRSLDKLGNKVVDNLNEASERRYKLRDAEINVTKYLLLIFAVALLGSLFFAFYLIAIGEVTPVGTFLYPIISLTIGFFSGYFAGGSGRTSSRK